MCKRKRRILILTRWHTTKCCDGEDIVTVFFNFFKIILYAPINISIYHDHLRLFNSTQLKIPYTWLNEWELQFVGKMYKERYGLFKNIEHYHTGSTFRCYNCKLQDSGGFYPIEKRRELLRDFFWLVSKHKVLKEQDRFRFIFLSVCERLIVDRNQQQKCDRFVYELYNAIQGREKFEHILCIY